MTLDEALAEIEHMRALLEASAMLDRDKDAEIERLVHDVERYMAIANDEATRAEAAEARAAAMKERCARVAEEYETAFRDFAEHRAKDEPGPAQISKYKAGAAGLIATAIRNLPDTDGDGT